jgi:hypothetical protein
MMKIPAYIDIPEPHRSGSSPEADFVSGWFFEGGTAKDLKERPGVDRRAALRAIAEILQSFDLEHGHKIAAAAFLLHQSFELPPEAP